MTSFLNRKLKIANDMKEEDYKIDLSQYGKTILKTFNKDNHEVNLNEEMKNMKNTLSTDNESNKNAIEKRKSLYKSEVIIINGEHKGMEGVILSEDLVYSNKKENDFNYNMNNNENENDSTENIINSIIKNKKNIKISLKHSNEIVYIDGKDIIFSYFKKIISKSITNCLSMEIKSITNKSQYTQLFIGCVCSFTNKTYKKGRFYMKKVCISGINNEKYSINVLSDKDIYNNTAAYYNNHVLFDIELHDLSILSPSVDDYCIVVNGNFKSEIGVVVNIDENNKKYSILVNESKCNVINVDFDLVCLYAELDDCK